MENHLKRLAAVFGLGVLGMGLGCEVPEGEDGVDPTLSALMEDGDAAAVAPGAMVRPAPIPPPPRFCQGDDCARSPLAFWRLDDCNPQTTALEDTAFSSPFPHPAFRAVSVACVAGVSGQGIRIDGDDDIMYAPDQPDFVFGKGLTVAAWINPDKVTGTQSLVRKRFDGTSSFLLAIDGKKLHFVLRLSNGRLVDVSAPVQARRFSHVAATHDGREAILYVDGAAVARARAVGSIAAGVGPIFVGNDANGRRFDGAVDEVWLNTLAAPADVIRGLTCVRKAPKVAFTPAVSAPQIAGTPVTFDLAITNQSSASCPVDAFEFFAAQIAPLSVDTFVGQVFAGPAETAHANINVKSSRQAAVGSYPFQYLVVDDASSDAPVAASATYVVGTGPVACDGFAPATPAIIGQPFSPTNGPAFTFAAPGLAAPVVTSLTSPDGFLQALDVSVAPGVPTDAANSFLGFGLGFGNPPCVDASQYVGVRFTVTGELGTCSPTFSVIPVSQDNAVGNGPFGTCTTGDCIPPRSGPITTGVNVVRFADMTGGSPLDTVDATALNGVQWTLTAPSDGVTAPCVAHFTISDVAFVVDPSAHQVSFTFDRDTQGWFYNQFDGPPFTNLAVHPAGAPPILSLDPMAGDPRPGSLRTTAPFTAVDQLVDAIVPLPFPGLNLSGKTLHARVRLASGSFPQGGVQFHTASGPSFVFAGTFVSPDQFPLGVWVPIDLDLAAAAAATPGFDPSQIVQIGVQFFSGFSGNGDVFSGAGDAVFEIDTVTD